MDTVVLNWAGVDRPFRLDFGRVMDLEQACDKTGIGAIYVRVAGGKFYVADIYHTIRLGLIGAGEPIASAEQLMRKHFDTRPMFENQAVAVEIFLALMSGLEPAPADAAPSPARAPAEPYKFREVSQICAVFHLSPIELRQMAYADFVNMLRGYAAGRQDDKLQPITEEEFMDILDRYEPKD